MPLSRFTQTFPLDFAAEISGSDAAPAGADLDDVFFEALEVVLAGVGVGVLAGVAAAVDFSAGVLAAVDEPAGAAISVVAFLLLLVFLVEVAVELSVAPLAGASADAGAAVRVSLADFFLLLFLELPVSLVPDLSASAPAASALFLLFVFFEPAAEPSALADLSASAVASALFFLLFLLVPEVSEPAACSPATASDDFFDIFLEVAPPELSPPESPDLAFLDDFFVLSEVSPD